MIKDSVWHDPFYLNDIRKVLHLHNAPKSCENDVAKWCHNGAKWCRNGAKIVSRWCQNCAKMVNGEGLIKEIQTSVSFIAMFRSILTLSVRFAGNQIKLIWWYRCHYFMNESIKASLKPYFLSFMIQHCKKIIWAYSKADWNCNMLKCYADH